MLIHFCYFRPSQSASSSQHQASPSTDSTHSTETISLSDDEQESRAEAAKKAKIETKESIVLREASFTAKVIAEANKVWSCTDVTARVDKSHVGVKYDSTKGVMTAKVKCLLCSHIVTMNVTKHDATSKANYKRHVTTKHLKKIIKNQPTLDNVLSKVPPTGDRDTDGTTSTNLSDEEPNDLEITDSLENEGDAT